MFLLQNFCWYKSKLLFASCSIVNNTLKKSFKYYSNKFFLIVFQNSNQILTTVLEIYLKTTLMFIVYDTTYLL